MKNYKTVSCNLIILESHELNYQELGELEEYIDALVSEGKIHIILDFSAVEYISSIGMGGLLTISQSLQQKKGSLKLIHVHAIYDMLITGGLHQIIDIYTKAE
ncbi:MAG: STAS domain-containing protein [SAR324 cluster bacterium]|nr:STAS domain-containing protein [SAR324 cluster bacterium]